MVSEFPRGQSSVSMHEGFFVARLGKVRDKDLV